MTPAVPRSQSTARTLRLLFLTLFLRGRSSRGLNRESAPKPVGRKLARSLALYAFFGMFARFLLHRPIEPRQLLWAKAGVLVEVSLWLSFALNLAGFFIGFAAPGGGWRFPIVHAMSTTLEALFCTGCVVLAYQLCLRWFGRERLDGLMTMAQVTVSVAAVMAGQLLPRLVDALGGEFQFTSRSWWIVFLPPVWFAGFDDALGGQGATSSWFLASIGLAATAAVAWTSFGKLARDYNTGLQILGESSPAPRR